MILLGHTLTLLCCSPEGLNAAKVFFWMMTPSLYIPGVGRNAADFTLEIGRAHV